MPGPISHCSRSLLLPYFFQCYYTTLTYWLLHHYKNLWKVLYVSIILFLSVHLPKIVHIIAKECFWKNSKNIQLYSKYSNTLMVYKATYLTLYLSYGSISFHFSLHPTTTLPYETSCTSNLPFDFWTCLLLKLTPFLYLYMTGSFSSTKMALLANLYNIALNFHRTLFH